MGSSSDLIDGPEEWSKLVKSFGYHIEPEMLWFVSHAATTLTLGKELDMLRGTAKLIYDIAWLPTGMLIIVWACGSENGVGTVFEDFARKCAVPITVLAH